MRLAALYQLEPSEAVLKCLRTPEICSRAREVAAIIKKEKEDGPKDMVAFLQMFFKQFVDTGRQLKLQDYWRGRSRSWLSSLLPCMPCPR